MVDQCLTGASNADVEGTHRDRRHIGWLSIDDVLDLSTTSATIHGPPCIFLPHLRRRSSESISQPAACTKTGEQNSVRSGKSEAELALDVLYYWNQSQTRSIARLLCDSRVTCIKSVQLFSLCLNRKSPFPITLAIGLYNSLYGRTSRNKYLHRLIHCIWFQSLTAFNVREKRFQKSTSSSSAKCSTRDRSSQQCSGYWKTTTSSSTGHFMLQMEKLNPDWPFREHILALGRYNVELLSTDRVAVSHAPPTGG